MTAAGPTKRDAIRVMQQDGAAMLLREAEHLIRQGWSQHADARGTDGQVVRAWDADAVAWSLLGSLVACIERRADTDGVLPVQHLAIACSGLADVVDSDSLELWNDDPLRTQDEVIHALRQAVVAINARGDGAV